MGSRSRSPVAAGPAEIFTDLRAEADRIRERLAREIPESDVEPPPEEAPAAHIARHAEEERARVLAAGARGLEKLAEGRDDEIARRRVVRLGSDRPADGAPRHPGAGG